MIHSGYINCSIETPPKIGGDDIKIDYGAMCEFVNMDIMIAPITGDDVSGVLLYNKHHQNNNGVIMTFSDENSIDTLIGMLLMAKDTLQEIQG